MKTLRLLSLFAALTAAAAIFAAFLPFGWLGYCDSVQEPVKPAFTIEIDTTNLRYRVLAHQVGTTYNKGWTEFSNPRLPVPEGAGIQIRGKDGRLLIGPYEPHSYTPLIYSSSVEFEPRSVKTTTVGPLGPWYDLVAVFRGVERSTAKPWPEWKEFRILFTLNDGVVAESPWFTLPPDKVMELAGRSAH